MVPMSSMIMTVMNDGDDCTAYDRCRRGYSVAMDAISLKCPKESFYRRYRIKEHFL